MPAHASGLLYKIMRLQKEYALEFDTQPTHEEIAEILGVTVDLVKVTLESGIPTTSLSSPVGSDSDDGRKLEDVIPDPDSYDPISAMDHEKLILAVREALSSLSPREEKIVRLRFGLSEEFDSEEFRITQEELDVLDSRLS